MKKSKIYRWMVTIFLLVVVLDMVSCSGGFLPGTYVSNSGKGADTLILFSNHKFKRICYPNVPEDKTRFVDTGSWVSEDGRDKTVVLRYWYNRTEYDHCVDEEKKGTILIMSIDRAYFIGSLRLLIDDDMGYYYIKK